MIADSRAQMNKFLYGVSDFVKGWGIVFLDRVKEVVMVDLSLQIQ